MMLISKLIKRLQDLKAKHGDLPVYCLMPGPDNSEEDEPTTDKNVGFEDIDRFNNIQRILIGRD